MNRDPGMLKKMLLEQQNEIYRSGVCDYSHTADSPLCHFLKSLCLPGCNPLYGGDISWDRRPILSDRDSDQTVYRSRPPGRQPPLPTPDYSGGPSGSAPCAGSQDSLSVNRLYQYQD